MTDRGSALAGCLGAAVLALALPLTGCAKPEIHIASGKVQVDGKPAGGVYVAFYSTANQPGTPAGSARSADDGSYSLRLRSAGEYLITAFWPTELHDEGSVVEGPDRFRRHCRSPRQPVMKVTVQSGQNLLEAIELRTR